MESCRPVFQISGIKNNGKKRDLLKGIQHLNGKYIGGSIYQSICTHLIIPQVLASEKFLASCAAGKWIVTPNYVLDSVENGSWLPEGPYEVSIPTRWMHCYTVRDWREKVISGTITGAFQGWRVLLMVQDAVSSIMFKRVLEAGAATVYSNPTHASITHVLAKPVTQGASSHNAPCYPVSHIVQYLFQRKSVNMDLNITNDDNEGKESADIDLSKLEVDLRDCAIKQQDRPRFIFTESMGYHSPHRSLSEGAEMAKFCNVGAMIECGLYMEALDTIQNAAFPGIVPPSSYMVSLIKYAQKGSATTVFLRRFRETMHRLLINTAPWHKKLFYSQVLQCPHCKKGQWPFLETAISYCLSSNDTCHQFPGPALPTLIQFHHDILAFFLNLFQRELNSITMGNLFQCPETEVCKVKTSGFLLYGTFWTVWERATLLSGAVKRLIELIMQAGHLAGSDEHKWHLLAILLDLLSVLVEFWCTQHFKLNPKLVEKGLEDLAEHFAITSQTVSSAVIVEMIARISTNRLKLPLVDAIFRNMCCKHGITVGDGPLSLKKVVLSYLPALGHLAQNHSWTQHTTNSCSSLDTNCETVSPVENELGRECIPGGLNKVNAAGQTLLHQACKKNEVDVVLSILASPGVDVNVKDHVGWTPLYEACNHGSTACVEALLRHRPTPLINFVVDGVSPLHGALLNGHLAIAKMLLEAAGSSLLRQTDDKSSAALDLISDASQKAELLRSAQLGDSNLNCTGVLNYDLLEAASGMLANLLVCYQEESGLSDCIRSNDASHTLARALETHPLQMVTLDWTDQQAVSLAGDIETLLELARGKHSEQVCDAVKAYKGDSTVVFMQLLDDLECQGKILMPEVNP
ncbi:SMC5-SMC6 complex localization factor protein 1 isoform X1 [Corythoichthys intestinalis]|uniref:SMC5-SMC6 complex localization factor protein 1 isoform X1 n=1 Tax=Corythoichthys intestinalis TaxID=161448 RepID=UPI0025A526BD|nr:SMC5-SMC6 complex localization factor protein 1 isoform X1 [Corythoichthys intestinalis]XP_057686992.1 SMC5-SMC6 complex localization factor protein 1 isoform X1 [Corythoichthys intestinalis]XP_057686993.1 SMC5-SMC6 complex localization factor protein 1 isoform X1 [Corythoichthys intestinalis]